MAAQASWTTSGFCLGERSSFLSSRKVLTVGRRNNRFRREFSLINMDSDELRSVDLAAFLSAQHPCRSQQTAYQLAPLTASHANLYEALLQAVTAPFIK
ncbi:hypothetical protein AcV5_003926 [Taiwanofungus camphoratus]|nr:hypothetical protein AcV5_003926 [Antrodia cinnamomea]